MNDFVQIILPCMQNLEINFHFLTTAQIILDVIIQEILFCVQARKLISISCIQIRCSRRITFKKLSTVCSLKERI